MIQKTLSSSLGSTVLRRSLGTRSHIGIRSLPRQDVLRLHSLHSPVLLLNHGSTPFLSSHRTLRSFSYDTRERRQSAAPSPRGNPNQHNEPIPSIQRQYQKKAQQFLEAVQSGRITRQVVTQKAEEHLLLCVSDATTTGHVPSDGPLALELLNVGIDHANIPHERLIPRLFALACQIMVRCGHPRAFREVHKQVWVLLEYQQHQQLLLNGHWTNPSNVAYNSRYVNDACGQFIHWRVMEAANKKIPLDKRLTQQIQRIVERLEQYYADPAIPLVGDGQIEHAIVLFLCRQQKPQQALQRVEKKLQNSKPSDIVPYQPPISTFNSIIAGFAAINQPERSREVVEWMLKEQEKENSPVPPPNDVCFNSLAHAYATVGGKDAGFQVENIIERMQELEATKGFPVNPSTSTFNIAINAWARSGHPDAPTRAEMLLQKMIDLSKAGLGTGPTEESWCSVMNTLCNAGKPGFTRRVTAMLDLMEKLHDNGSLTESLSDVAYTISVKAWEMEAFQNGDKRQQLRYIDRILQVVDRVHGRGFTPSTELFNAVLTAVATISPMDGILYFLELERPYRRGEVRLEIRTFNIALNAIATLNRPDTEDKAFHMFQRIEEYAKNDPCVTPTCYTYNILLKVLSRSHADDAAIRAENLLLGMDAMTSLSPDSTSYVTCIIAWGRSTHDDKFEHVRSLLNRFLGPTGRDKNGWQNAGAIKVLNAALSVCRHNAREQPVSAMNTATFAMKELRKNDKIRPDQTTYRTFFGVFQEVDLDGHPHRLKDLTLLKDCLRQCIDDGLITSDLMKTVFNISPTEMMEIAGHDIATNNFVVPPQWSRNIKQQR